MILQNIQRVLRTLFVRRISWQVIVFTFWEMLYFPPKYTCTSTPTPTSPHPRPHNIKGSTPCCVRTTAFREVDTHYKPQLHRLYSGSKHTVEEVTEPLHICLYISFTRISDGCDKATVICLSLNFIIPPWVPFRIVGCFYANSVCHNIVPQIRIPQSHQQPLSYFHDISIVSEHCNYLHEVFPSGRHLPFINYLSENHDVVAKHTQPVILFKKRVIFTGSVYRPTHFASASRNCHYTEIFTFFVQRNMIRI